MTTHKTISSLSIAAIALMAAAVPALAQSQTEPSGQNVSANGAATVVEQTIASNLESSTVKKSRAMTPKVGPVVNNAVRTNKPLVLSASAFKGQNNFTSTTNTSNFANQVSFKDAGPMDPGAKKQFRADESDVARTKSVAFVPSLGQKLPE
jgi:hypothetical protein